MMLTMIVATYLRDIGQGELGNTLFYGFMPHQIPTGSVVLCRTPIEEDAYTGLRKGTFQVVTRDATADLAYNKAAAIRRVLRLEGADIGNVSFKFILPRHDPLVYPRSDGGLFEASVNYQFSADNWE